MDLLRSTLKALFYDYPLDAVANYIKNGRSRESGDFFSRMKELLAWREKGFSTSEISLLKGILKDEWLCDADYSFAAGNHYHPYERIPLILEKCGRELLNVSGINPRVQIRHLLRWRDLSLLIGEDSLILPLIAKEDLRKKKERTVFQWPNVLGHDDLQLNGILNETLSDTHFHLNAGCDVFEFNWLIVMNHPECLFKDIPDSMDEGEMRDYDPIKRHSDINLKLKEWIVIASYIRALLMNIVSDETFIIQEETLCNTFDSKRIQHIKDCTLHLIEPFGREAFKTSNGIILDYAVHKGNIKGLSNQEISNVYMAHHGERWLLYNFFRQYFGGNENIRRATPWLYLYLLVKNKLRREIIQTNDLRGFENFQIYQSLKQVFFTEAGDKRAMLETAYRYAIQSAMGESFKHNIEARITPDAIKLYQKLDFKQSLFGNIQVINDEMLDKVTLVCHFIKKPEVNLSGEIRKLRHGDYRNKLKGFFRKIKKAFENDKYPKLVGIDAAANELTCRPEVFAPVYQMAQDINLSNNTYHVGEDFYDIVDGLRAIDEAIKFLHLSSGSRIGHAIALGIDAKDYYESRHRYIIIPKQNLLDNLVWLKYTAMEHNIQLSPTTILFISERYHELIEDLKYDDGGSDSYYWAGMKLRGSDPLEKKLSTSNNAEKLLDNYWYNVDTQKRGRTTISTRLPESFVDDVARVQECLYDNIISHGLFIESNPTSNYMIGGFNRYIDLPLFKFHSLHPNGRKLPVSISTDDKGVFATSLKNEYSLIAVALRKEKNVDGKRMWNDKQIIDYLNQLAYYGNLSRFGPKP